MNQMKAFLKLIWSNAACYCKRFSVLEVSLDIFAYVSKGSMNSGVGALEIGRKVLALHQGAVCWPWRQRELHSKGRMKDFSFFPGRKCY